MPHNSNWIFPFMVAHFFCRCQKWMQRWELIMIIFYFWWWEGNNPAFYPERWRKNLSHSTLLKSFNTNIGNPEEWKEDMEMKWCMRLVAERLAMRVVNRQWAALSSPSPPPVPLFNCCRPRQQHLRWQVSPMSISLYWLINAHESERGRERELTTTYECARHF